MDSQKVIDAIEAAGYESDDDYSGRGMYGKSCVAVRCDKINEAFDLFAAIGAEDADLASELARGARTDNIGLGMVVYWPSAKTEHANEDAA